MVAGPSRAAFTAALISFSLCPLVGRWAERIGVVSIPSKDRWREHPTPMLGGVAIAAGTVVAAVVFRVGEWNEAALLGPAIGLLALGLVDDRITLGPTAKLVGSLAAGAGLVYLLSQSPTHFPQPALVVLAVVWFAAVVHAVNLLDNIDGLAAGVGAITSCGTALVLLQYGAPGPAALLMAAACAWGLSRRLAEYRFATASIRAAKFSADHCWFFLRALMCTHTTGVPWPRGESARSMLRRASASGNTRAEGGGPLMPKALSKPNTRSTSCAGADGS